LGKIIAVCNQKGGVGKTTTAINLSAYLAHTERKILLVDIDPQGNATSGIGIEKAKIKKNVYNLIVEQATPAEVSIKTAVENLFLIPSSIELTGAEVELVGTIGREYKLQKLLKPEKENFEFIFIDCPPSLGLLTINALTAADAVLIPIQCEYYALEGLSQLLNTVNLVKENLNPSLEVEGVLLTMADYRTKLTKEVIDEAKTFFKEKVYSTVIPRSIRLSEAPGFGKPILLYDKTSSGAKTYERLSIEFLGQKLPEGVQSEMMEAEKIPGGEVQQETPTTKQEEIA